MYFKYFFLHFVCFITFCLLYLRDKIINTMKNQMTYRLIIPFLVLILFSNCKDKDEVTPEPPVTVVPNVDWTKSENFEDGLYLSKVIDGRLFAINGRNFYYDVDLNSATNPQNFAPYLSRAGRYRIPISDKVLATRTETDIFIFPANDISIEKSKNIKLTEEDVFFKFFEDIPFWQGDAWGLNSLGTILIPYRVQKAGIAVDSPYFILIKTEINENGEIEIKEKKLIQEEIIGYYDNCYRIESFGSFFLAQVGVHTFRIDNDGTVEKISDSTSKSVKLDNEIVSIETDRNSGEISIKKSNLEGKNWSTVGKFPYNQTVFQAEYSGVDNKIIGFLGSELFQLNINQNKLELIYLQDSKLEGGKISSISLLDNSKVFVTSVCDGPIRNCGGFYKSLSDFFKPKNLDK